MDEHLEIQLHFFLIIGWDLDQVLLYFVATVCGRGDNAAALCSSSADQLYYIFGAERSREMGCTGAYLEIALERTRSVSRLKVLNI